MSVKNLLTYTFSFFFSFASAQNVELITSSKGSQASTSLSDKQTDKLNHEINQFLINNINCITNLKLYGNSFKKDIYCQRCESKIDLLYQLHEKNDFFGVEKGYIQDYENTLKKFYALAFKNKIQSSELQIVFDKTVKFVIDLEEGFKNNKKRILSKYSIDLPEKLFDYIETEINFFENFGFALKNTIPSNIINELKNSINLCEKLFLEYHKNAEDDYAKKSLKRTFDKINNLKKEYLNNFSENSTDKIKKYNQLYTNLYFTFNKDFIFYIKRKYNYPYSKSFHLNFHTNNIEFRVIDSINKCEINLFEYPEKVYECSDEDKKALTKLLLNINHASSALNKNADNLYDYLFLSNDTNANLKAYVKTDIYYFKNVIKSLSKSKRINNLIITQINIYYHLLMKFKRSYGILSNTYSHQQETINLAYSDCIITLDKIDKQAEVLQKNINLATLKFSNENRIEKKLHDFLELLRGEIKNHIFNQGISNIKELNILHYKLIENKKIYLQNIEKKSHVENNICSINFYDKIIETTDLVLKNINLNNENSKVFKKGCCDGYSHIITYFNTAILNYNKFVLSQHEKENLLAFITKSFLEKVKKLE